MEINQTHSKGPGFFACLFFSLSIQPKSDLAFFQAFMKIILHYPLPHRSPVKHFILW